MNARWIALSALAAVIPIACNSHDATSASPTGSAAPSASTPISFSVEPVTVVEKELDVTVRLPGELAPYEQVDIYPRANGFVRSVSVDRGSTVKAGQVLVRLDAPELMSQRLEAEAKVAGDRTTVDRLQAAQKQLPGAVAEHDIELADAARRVSSARVSSLRTLENFLVITAPFDGVVTERSVHPGALVGPSSGAKAPPLLRIESVAKLRLTVAVPEDQTSALKMSDTLDFSVRAWPQRKFKGTIVRIARSVDPRTRTMPVELDVDNTDGALASGMYASVSWRIRRPAPTLFVPESSVLQTTEKTLVVRIKDGKADPVTVQRGVAMAGSVEVFGDLLAGDIVAKRGSEELKSGVPITIRTANK